MNAALSLGKVVEFVCDKHPYAGKWAPETVSIWVSIFIRNGWAICTTTEDGAINGLVMYRLVMHPEDGIEYHYAFDPEGACVFLDFTAGTSEVRSGLIQAVLHRVGMRPLVAWERRERLRVYSSERFLRHNLKKETHHGGS